MDPLTNSSDTTMERTNQPPIDSKSTAALVVRAVDAIDGSTKERRDALLSELSRMAWGNNWAQKQ